MWPRFNQIEKFGTRTLRSDELPMGVNFVVGCELSKLNSFLHNQKARVQLSKAGKYFVEGSNVSDSYAAGVIA